MSCTVPIDSCTVVTSQILEECHLRGRHTQINETFEKSHLLIGLSKKKKKKKKSFFSPYLLSQLILFTCMNITLNITLFKEISNRYEYRFEYE